MESPVDWPLPVEALIADLWPDYDLAPASGGERILGGFNDHYLISTSEGEYVLRVYRHGWRTEDDIAYEIAVLTHLDARGVPVCAPIARRGGGYHRTIPAPEGPRIAVLFPWAAGDKPDATDPHVIRACGRIMALIHEHTNDFTCEHERFHLDLEHLIEQPLATMLTYLAHRPADASLVKSVARELRAGLAGQIDNLDWGFCHGDFFGGNMRIDAEGTLRVFDFDCGGLGWRAYDLCVCRLYCAEEARWEVFCAAYQDVRPLPEVTRAAIPWFLVTRQLWRMALFADNWPRLTLSTVNDDFLDEHLGILRERIRTYLPELPVG
jgi:Ser/Thr protein kinase RdoA (MazF antagonist)